MCEMSVNQFFLELFGLQFEQENIKTHTVSRNAADLMHVVDSSVSLSSSCIKHVGLHRACE